MEALPKQLLQLLTDYYQQELYGTNSALGLTVRSQIMEADPLSEVPGTDVLERELVALNMELFGMAWLGYNYELYEEGKKNQEQVDIALCNEIILSGFYSEAHRENERNDTWGAAGFYNNAILEAAIAENTSTNWSTFRSILGDYRPHPSREKETRLIVEHFREHYDELLRDYVDDGEHSLRLSNRIAGVGWRDGIAMPQRLSLALAQRLGLAPSSEVLFLFQRLAVGLYKNARDYIDAVIDYGSWKQARKATLDLRQTILEKGQELLEEQERNDD